MKKIYYIAVGKPLSREMAALHDEYVQRLKRWTKIEHSVIKSEKNDTLPGVRIAESDRILAALPENAFIVLLDERGKQFSSETFSEQCCSWLAANRPLVFVIGGAFGVSDELRKRADIVWSLSSLVFPHEVVRLLLVEQLYRALAINNNLPYHHK